MVGLGERVGVGDDELGDPVGSVGSVTSNRLFWKPVVRPRVGGVLAQAEHPAPVEHLEVGGVPGDLQLAGHAGAVGSLRSTT